MVSLAPITQDTHQHGRKFDIFFDFRSEEPKP